MSPQRLMEYFEQVSEAPDAVPRLRRFILDLAVHGKLVEQIAEDEPAAELLKRVQKGKDTLINEGKVKKEKSIDLIAEEEPYSLPVGWAWTALGNTGRIFNGNSVSETEKHELSKVSEGLPFIATKDVGYGRDRLSYDNGLRVPLNAKDYKVAHANAVLICAEGGSAGKKIGLADRDICFGNKLFANEVWAGIHPLYILSLYQSSSFYTQFKAKMTGIIGGIARSEFLALQVPIPPLLEQNRIVMKVDELMKLCDDLEATQAKRERRRDRLVSATLHGFNNGVKDDESDEYLPFEESARFYFNHLPRLTTRPDHIKQLRQTILNLAVRGKLVPQDAKDEPALETLRLIKERKELLVVEGKIRKERLLEPLEKTPFSLPATWKWTKIGDWSLTTDYGTSVKSTHSDKGIPVLSMGDIQNGNVNLCGQKKVSKLIDDLPHLFLKRSDLLYNRTNSAELVGKTGIFLGEDDAFTLASYLIRIRFDRELANPFYANLAMNAPYFRETQIVPELKQQCGQANVNGTKLRNMIIPVPPLKEQHRIVAKVHDLMKLCDELEARVTMSANTRHQLLEATLCDALSA